MMSTIPPTASYDALYTQPAREQLFQSASQYLDAADLHLLEQACAYAFHAHDGVVRKSGEPYITHPIAVATELAKWGMDVQTLCAGLMHDVLEDTEINKAQMAALFGDVITELVDGVSKLDKIEFTDKAEHQAESFSKLILAMTRDIRVIIIKLADRLHNMRTLGGVPKIAKRRSTARETLDIFAPIANRLGINVVYRELQELAFQHLYPERYQVLHRAMEIVRYKQVNNINKIQQKIQEKMALFQISGSLNVVPKNLYSIYQKMKRRQQPFNKTHDIYSLQVTVHSVADCYTMLGVVHSAYKPTPGRIKDFIAIPKSNGYQSLHTTLNTHDFPMEVQIRTQPMNMMAEFGVLTSFSARHQQQNDDYARAWLDNVSNLKAGSDNSLDFVENIKADLFSNEVHVFTRSGEIKQLPRGATPIDFAYAVHTDIGNHCVAARVDGKLVPLRTVLRNGVRVEVMTSPHARPSPAWLGFVKSARARTAIRHYVKKTTREDAEQLGKTLLAKALNSLLPSHVTSSKEVQQLYEDYLQTQNLALSDVCIQIGLGQMLPITVAMDIAKLLGEQGRKDVRLGKIQLSEHIRVRFGACCHPVAGDVVYGVVTPNEGLLVHRDMCSVLLKTPPEQQLEADWGVMSAESQSYDTEILVSALDGQGLLAELTAKIAYAHGNIARIDTLPRQSGVNVIEFRFLLNVHDLTQLSQIMTALRAIPNVQSVVRV